MTIWMVAIVTNLISAAVCSIAGFFFARWQGRRLMPEVDIAVIRIGEERLPSIKPLVLVATYSGINPLSSPGMSAEERLRINEEFKLRVTMADYEALGLSADTPSIGSTIRAVDTYKDTLRKVVLLTTWQSRASVPLLRAYLRDRVGFAGEIDDSEAYRVNLDDDVLVTRASYEKTKVIFKKLRDEKLRGRGQVLVDVTGGVRSMQLGVFLACLGREQDVQIVGAQYGPNGRFLPGTSFPMIVSFAPHLRKGIDL